MKNRIQEDLGQMAQLLGQLAADTRQNLQGVGQTIGDRFNLVSQEDFEIQQAITSKLRIHLDSLEQRIETLEAAQQPDATAD
ncbi:MAG: accessory factor UbiK family protein [Immundisolibacteraceae bacterium]|nr:accessory factor UbiK family protein [Immundisolibacteraceae bacterium]